MKQLLLMSAFIALMSTELVAQEKAIEIRGLENKSIESVQEDGSIIQKGNHQFEISANQDVDVYLKVKLKQEGNVNVLVTDKKGKVVLSKKYQKKGNNRLTITMSRDEKYIVNLLMDKQSNMTVELSES